MAVPSFVLRHALCAPQCLAGNCLSAHWNRVVSSTKSAESRLHIQGKQAQELRVGDWSTYQLCLVCSQDSEDFGGRDTQLPVQV